MVEKFLRFYSSHETAINETTSPWSFIIGLETWQGFSWKKTMVKSIMISSKISKYNYFFTQKTNAQDVFVRYHNFDLLSIDIF
jgi:hypothetical protein